VILAVVATSLLTAAFVLTKWPPKPVEDSEVAVQVSHPSQQVNSNSFEVLQIVNRSKRTILVSQPMIEILGRGRKPAQPSFYIKLTSLTSTNFKFTPEPGGADYRICLEFAGDSGLMEDILSILKVRNNDIELRVKCTDWVRTVQEMTVQPSR